MAAASEDDALARECLAGNQDAWEALIAKYKRLVYSIPFRYGLPAEEAADVFQAVWADLYRDLRKIENAAALRGWLVTATARRCLLHKKRWLQTSGSALDPQLADYAPDPAALLHAAEKDLLVRAASVARNWCACCFLSSRRVRMKPSRGNWDWPKDQSGSSAAAVWKN